MANTENPKDTKAASSGAPIECRVVKSFYSENMQFIEKGTSPYIYKPQEDQPFPWPILRPLDDKLSEPLREEYEKARERKLHDIRVRRERRFNLEAAAKGI